MWFSMIFLELLSWEQANNIFVETNSQGNKWTASSVFTDWLKEKDLFYSLKDKLSR